MSPIRLGFAVRVVSDPRIRAAVSSHQGQFPHLSMNLIALRDVLLAMERNNIHFYRCAPELLPSPEHPTPLAQQIAECEALFAMLAAQCARQQVRLTLHMPHGLGLDSAETRIIERTQALIETAALLFKQLRVPAGYIVLHLCSAASDTDTLSRFAHNYAALSAPARACVALEHDLVHGLGTCLQAHERCGVGVVFDLLHWSLYNPDRLVLSTALGLALATWAIDARPKVHLSTGRSEAHLAPARAQTPAHVLSPRSGQHADFIAVADAMRLLEAARGLPAFDLMLEAKAGDLAVLRLRKDLEEHAPQLRTLVD